MSETFLESHIWDSSTRIKSISLNKAENKILFGCDDGVIRFYEIYNNKFKIGTEIEFYGHKKSVENIIWTDLSNNHFVSFGSDGVINFWAIISKTPIKTISTESKYTGLSINLKDNIFSVCFSNDDGGPEPKGIEFYDTKLETLKFRQKLSHRAQFTNWVENNNKFVYSTYNVITISEFRNQNDKIELNFVEKLKICSDAATCTSLNITDDEKFLLVGSTDSSITVFSTKNWTCLQTLYPFPSTIKAMTTISDLSLVLSSSSKPSIMLSDFKSTENKKVFLLHRTPKFLVYGQNKKFVVCGYDSKNGSTKHDYCASIFDEKDILK
ncbi:hypothetical protein MHBO_000561 [Bonamia ostreae]|uniref:Uncharacterized protein n=1 Tax=Bonamia ostreae TaxID=126728 RepID=A0ABV2AG46_9EUKA